MRKRRLKKFLSSIFVSDHEDSEVSKKEEMESKLEEILKLVSAEQKDEKPDGGSELVSLVENFYEGYLSLHGRYNHLLEKLKNSVDHKKEMNGSFLGSDSSSDSDSSDSESNKKKHSKTHGKEVYEEQISLEDYGALQRQVEDMKSKNIELENEAKMMTSKLKQGENLASELAQKEMAILALEEELQSVREGFRMLELENTSLNLKLENSNKQHADVNQKLSDIKAENETHASEKSSMLNKFTEAEKCNKDLKDEIEVLQKDNSGLKQELELTIKQVADLNEQLDTINKEKEMLLSENIINSGKVQEYENVIDDLRNTIDANLTAAASEKAEQIDELHLEKEEASRLRTALNQELANTKEEISVLSSEIQRSGEHAEEAEKTIKKLNKAQVKLLNTNAGLEKELQRKIDDIDALSLQNANAIEEIKQLQEHGEKLSVDLERLHKENSQLSIECESLRTELEAAERKISESGKMLKEIQEGEHVLIIENEKLNLEKSSVSARLEDAEKIIQEMKTEKSVMEQDIMKLQDEKVSQKEELETVVNELCDLKIKMTTISNEKDGLLLELAAAVSKIAQAEKDIETLTSEISVAQKLADEKLTNNVELLVEIEHLNLKLEEGDQQMKEMAQELATEKEEIYHLNSEISENSARVQEIEKSFEELKANYELLDDEKSELVSIKIDLDEKLRSQNIKLEELSSKHAEAIDTIKVTQEQVELLNKDNSHLSNGVEDLKIELESACQKASELQTTNEALCKEREMLSAEKLELLSRIEQHEKLADVLKSDMEAKRDELLSLESKIAEIQREASAEIETITTHSNNLQDEVNILQSQKDELMDQIKLLTGSFSDNKILVGKLQGEIEDKISDHTKNLNEYEEKFQGLKGNYKLLEDELQESHAKLRVSQDNIKELEAKEEKLIRLEVVALEQERGIKQLEGNHKEILEELAHTKYEKINFEKENLKLQEQLEMLEVQLRLTNQKLKITETESKAKDESNKIRIEQLLKEHCELEEQVAAFSGKQCAIDSELIKLRGVLNVEFSRLGDDFLNLKQAFDKNCVHLHSRLSKCHGELQAAIQVSEVLVSDNAKVQHEKYELLVKLAHNDDIIAMLQEESGSLNLKLVATVKEEERLRAVTAEYEKRLIELEKTVKAKEEEGLLKDNEKREAIRQLCYQIEYHRENCCKLYQILSAKERRSKSST